MQTFTPKVTVQHRGVKFKIAVPSSVADGRPQFHGGMGTGEESQFFSGVMKILRPTSVTT